MEKHLKEQLKFYEDIADERIKELNILREKEKFLCNDLCEGSQVLPHDKIPSEETLEFMRSIVKSLESEKVHREQKLKFLRSSIAVYCEDLCLSALDLEEHDLVFGAFEYVVLSLDNIEQLKSLSEKLRQKVFFPLFCQSFLYIIYYCFMSLLIFKC